MAQGIRTSVIFSILAIDLAAFFVLYVIHAYFFRGFSFVDGLAVAGYELYWRLISLHILIQAILMFVGASVLSHRELLSLLASFTAYVMACLISFSSIRSVFELLAPPTKDTMGEGFALLVSLFVSLAVVRFIQR